MKIGLIIVYFAAIVLGILPVACVSRLRKIYRQPFLGRFQSFAFLLSLVTFSDLIIRYLGPGLNVIRRDQTRNLSMLFGLILIPALIALCYLFARLVFSLLKKPVPRPLAAVYAVFWGLFFVGFIYAEVRYFQTGSMSATRVLEVVFDAGLSVFFFGPALVLLLQARNLPDPGQRTLAGSIAAAYLVIFPVPLLGRIFASGLFRHWMIIEYAILLVLNAGIAFFMQYHLRRAQPAGPGSSDSAWEEVFARFRITRREQDVVRGILDGRSNAEIAEAFFISEKTVETHVYNIYQKTGVKSRIQLLNLFRETSGPASVREGP